MANEIAAAAMTARMKLPDIEEKDKPKRRPIPDHIPRTEVELIPGVETCADCSGRLRLIGARGPVVVEGPFARNPDYLDMLACLRPEGVETALSATGTSVGAAMLSLAAATPPETRRHPAPPDAARLSAYAAQWRAALPDPD